MSWSTPSCRWTRRPTRTRLETGHTSGKIVLDATIFDAALDHYLVVEGRHASPKAAPPTCSNGWATVYIGPGVRFPPFDDPPPGYLLRIAPTASVAPTPWTSDEAVEAADRVGSHSPGEGSPGA